MDLGIPGGCCSGQTMVDEREMKEQGWTWGFLDGVATDRPHNGIPVGRLIRQPCTKSNK